MTVAGVAREHGLIPPHPIPRATPMGTIGFLNALRNNPLTIWTRAHYELPILTGRSLMGEVAVINDPQAIGQVFLDNAANYPKDKLQLRVLAPGLGRGLLTADGDEWKAQRRALAPLFTPRMVARFIPAMEAGADHLIERWQRQRDGRRVDVAHEMARVTLDVLERTIFTDGLGRGPDEFMAAVTAYFNTLGRIDPFDALGFPDWVPRFGKHKAAKTLAFFDAAVEAMIVKRQASLTQDRSAAPRDLLTLLLEARDPQTGEGLRETTIRSNIITFIGAGHETTANALSWTLFLLSQSPEWMGRVREEIDGLGEAAMDEARLGQLVQTRAVFEESMRLYPPAPTLTRDALEADELAGVRINKGARVIVSPWVVHRHKTLWRDPDAFDPTRFLPENRDSIHRFAYLPFGAGPRVCIGAAFATQEALIVLRALLRHFSFELPQGHVVTPYHRITLRPEGGLPMMVKARR